MYTDYFGFKEKPFTLSPDPAFLYLSKQHQRALSMLTYGLETQAGVTVITGEVGSGKTTLIRHVLHTIDNDINVGLISNAHHSFGDLMQWVLKAYKVDTNAIEKADRYQAFVDFLINEYAENRRTVLIIDEAQNMHVETLEELRLLTNINADKHILLQLVLIGQPELLNVLQRYELRQLAQRVSVDFKIDPLGYRETVAYIKHRLVVAGGDESLFDKFSLAAIYYHSQGIPRLINTLCDFALVYVFAEGLLKINLNIIVKVIQDKQRGGIFPITVNETEQQVIVRRLIREEIDIDILADITDQNEDIISEL